MRDLRCVPAAMCLCLALLAGCAGTPPVAETRHPPTPPITHVVLIQLKDPTRAQELILDCNRTLPNIASVMTYSCGTPLANSRPNVADDYSVGIYVGFKDEDGYRVYADDPGHLALVEKWRAAWKSIRIFDILEVETPASGGQPAGPVALPPATAAPTDTNSAPAAGGSPAPGAGPASGSAPPSAAGAAPAPKPAAPPQPRTLAADGH